MEGIGKGIQSMGTYLNKSNSFLTDLLHKIIIKKLHGLLDISNDFLKSVYNFVLMNYRVYRFISSPHFLTSLTPPYFYSFLSIPISVSLPPPFPSSVLGIKARILLSLEKTSATEFCH